MTYSPATTHRFLHVAFNFRGGIAKSDELIPLVNSATDWYRYAPNCWLLWTNGTPEAWFNYLKPQLHKDDYMFICELNKANVYGWLPQGGWDFLSKTRTDL